MIDGLEAERWEIPGVVLEAYRANVEQALQLARALPDERYRRNGLLAWNGDACDFGDAITSMVYGHKREHTTQITLFRSSAVSAGSHERTVRPPAPRPRRACVVR